MQAKYAELVSKYGLRSRHLSLSMEGRSDAHTGAGGTRPRLHCSARACAASSESLRASECGSLVGRVAPDDRSPCISCASLQVCLFGATEVSLRDAMREGVRARVAPVAWTTLAFNLSLLWPAQTLLLFCLDCLLKPSMALSASRRSTVFTCS
eukprot:6203212-Pleurochrysis_carterae.AAC.2